MRQVLQLLAGTFPHRRHEKEMGKLHCHACHAFEGHAGVVTRKEGCPECHEAGEY